ncbi:MAG: T9SS type A sorting domain-containing protein [Bacteroidaceae bacterium]|nr:T9SS type A sorting domain-containing protein [Bacteroidaceae bacterium]
MGKRILLLFAAIAIATGAEAQYLKEHYISWGPGSEGFGTALQNWTPGAEVTPDDNFFISRVKPKARFRNAATQVKDTLQSIYDKKLICWLPINSINETGWNRNALPDGLFDSEVFSMWSYVTHWGNWTASLGRVPGALLDVAHKNGVAVSGLASVPNAALSDGWATSFRNMVNAGADKAAQYLSYYGIDGLGYNSEWSESSYAASQELMPFHKQLVAKMRETNPLFENIWYTGTNDVGSINFAGQLGTWNQETFGDADNIRTSLFLNYNWNVSSRITQSQRIAANLGRDPLDLYAGFNMQGANPTSWNMLSRARYSIGLWGAHSANMFFESRHEKGSDPAVKQATYLLRTERWFTGGTRNPLNSPDLIDSDNYNADNFSFHGMSKLMSARSSLCWNLSEEPFITYFNLGNGQYFNWQGERQHNSQWYNLGVQDYLPTWRYWFSTSILGHQPTRVATNGLDAEFTWDEAYVGGSALRIYGTTTTEYLHLFKTQFALQEGDLITVRYKHKSGSARQVNLLLTAEGNETKAINLSDFALITSSDVADEEDWVTKQFTVTGDLAGKTLALVALQFRTAKDLDLYLGEFSIVRGESPVPAKPVISKAEVLASHYQGVDGKLIWNMPNTKAAGEPCYNLDVNTSMFKLYAQQEGQEPVFMGLTTSWAGMVFCAPINFSAGTANKVRFGVAALSLDHKSQSETAWSDYMETGTYAYNDNIQTDKYVITPDEPFVMSYVDPNHESGQWKLTHESGTVAFEGEGSSVTVPGLTQLGRYTLVLTGKTHTDDTTADATRTFEDYITVTDAKFGRLPEITSLTANGQEADITVEPGEGVLMAYTGRNSDGGTSQAVDLKEKNFGFNVKDAGLTGNTSFSLAFWLKINQANGSTQFFSVANKAGSWPLTDWGWNWSTMGTDGSLNFTYRNSQTAERPATSSYSYPAGTMPIGLWTHVAIVFDRQTDGTARHKLYINGKFIEPNVSVNAYSGGTATSGMADTYYSLLGMEDAHYISIGGPASGRGGIDGVIDNVVLYKRAITDAEVARTMEPLDPAALPSGLNCLWNLEEKAASDYSFAAVGSTPDLKCGSYELIKLEGEGRAQPHFVEPTYTAGCPQAEDAGYPVLTEYSWKAVKGTITNATGNGEAGSATVTYQQEGVRNVTLTLSNPLGSDSRTFSTITVGDLTGIAEVSADKLRAYTVGEVVYIDFQQPGNYNAAVYNVAGQLVCSKSASIKGTDRMRIALPQPGIYVVRVYRDGKPAASVKLLRN